MQRKFVTSMSRKIFDAYGKDMLEGWINYWPRGEMHVYSEDGELPLEHKRITYHDLTDIAGIGDFMLGTEFFRIFEGETLDGRVDYRYQVRRFARKAFAQMDAAVDYRGLLFWIDADVTTHKHIPGALLDEWMRGSFMAVMRRKTWHICSSFVGWDCGHSFAQIWWPHYANVYESGQIFTLPQWDDAFVLEQTLHGLEGIRDIAEHITGDGPYNVFDDVFKGYASHDKGPAKLKKIA